MAEAMRATPAAPGRTAPPEDPLTQDLFAAAREGDLPRAEAALAAAAATAAAAPARGAGAAARLRLRDAWGLTALHSAALAGFAPMVAWLLEHGAEVDAPSEQGKTALHLAVAEGHDKVVSLLSGARADIIAPTTYGSMPLELARRNKPGGACERLLREELHKRLARAESHTRDLRNRLDSAEATKHIMLEQLDMQLSKLGQDGAADAVEVSCDSKEAVGANGASGYWGFVQRAITDMRAHGEGALSRTRLRPHATASDAFTWHGPLVATAPTILPELDADDAELVTSFQSLQLTIQQCRRREARKPPGTAVSNTPDELGRQMEEQTGRSMRAWAELVSDLGGPEARWDWSKVEVQDRKLSEAARSFPGVFAVAPNRCEDASDWNEAADWAGNAGPVFRKGGVIGPMGGTMRKRTRYERLYYEKGTWFFHDPQAYAIKLRAQTSDLRLEPLVLDLSAGAAQNRLRYVADVRTDPLDVQAALGLGRGAGRGGARAPLLPPRKWSNMPRVRSRPPTPPSGGLDAAEDAPPPQEPPPAVAASPEAAAAAASASSAPGAAEVGAAGEEEATANVQLVEVLVDSWPYVFAVAARDIHDGEELTVDFGRDYWASQYAALVRLREVSRISHDMILGSDFQEDEAAEGAYPGVN